MLINQRLVLTAPQTTIPNSFKPYCISWWDARKRLDTYYEIPQVVTNGNFANGTTGWVARDCTLSVVEGELVCKYSTASQTAGIYYSVDIIIGHKYYIRASIYPKYSKGVYIGCGGVTPLMSAPIANQWNTYDVTITPSATSPFVIYHDVRTDYVANSTWKVSNYLAIDLTATFGAGNEPSRPEMNAIIATDGAAYWEGSRNILCNPLLKYFWHDYSGNGRHMKLSGLAYSAGSTLSANGFEVDGVDDYGSISDNVSMRLTTGGTLMAWIYPKTIGEFTGRIFDKSTTANINNGYALFLGTNNTINCTINAGTNTASKTNSITLNKWQFVVATFCGVGRNLYVDGVNVTASGGTETALPPDVAGPICIGNRAGATDRTFNGYIDKAAIITRVLTTQEIQKYFQNSRKHYGV